MENTVACYNVSLALPYLTGKACYRLVLRPPVGTMHVPELTFRLLVTALGLQYRRRGSCHTPVFTWRPSIPSRGSSSVERTAGQCHRRTIVVLIPATPEDISFPATTASITLITVSWS